MNKKILLVGWGYPPNIDGGLDIHVKHLFEELQRKDIDAVLALPEERAPDKENIIGIETGEGDMAWNARKMSSQIAEIAENYDIIHTHDWFGAEAGFKAKKYSNCKWISTLHSLSSGRSRGSIGGEVSNLEELAATEADKVLAVSEKLAYEVDEEFEERTSVVHNGFSQPSGKGVDVKEKLGIDGDMIFFVGRHAEQKGIEHLLYGFRKFIRDGNEASLVIGGDGYMRKSLEKFAEMLEVEEKVYFEGFIPSDELGDYYSDADIFVSPSINEPFGLTITEALESNTAVVATSNGVSEIVSDDCIVSVDSNSDSIARGLRKGLARNVDIDEEGRSWEDMSQDLIEIYEEL